MDQTTMWIIGAIIAVIVLFVIISNARRKPGGTTHVKTRAGESVRVDGDSVRVDDERARRTYPDERSVPPPEAR